MSVRAAYKGYIVDANPHKLASDERWSTDLTIERHDGKGISIRPFSGILTFTTKVEAIQHCLELGGQIIEGAYPSCSAP